MVRVTDAAGNSSTCIAITVKMNNPVLEEPLPDITVSCDYDIVLSDLEEFGTIIFDAADRSEIEIESFVCGAKNMMVGLQTIVRAVLYLQNLLHWISADPTTMATS